MMVEGHTEGIVGSFGADSFVGNLYFADWQTVSIFAFSVPNTNCVGCPYPPASSFRRFRQKS